MGIEGLTHLDIHVQRPFLSCFPPKGATGRAVFFIALGLKHGQGLHMRVYNILMTNVYLRI